MENNYKVICEVSRRHYHPGKNSEKKYSKKRDLSQAGQWVANEKVFVDNMSFAVVMPERNEGKYELSITDWKQLFEKDPDFHGREFTIQLRHFHCDPHTAKKLEIKDGDMVSIYKDGIRAGQLDNILVRIDSSFSPRIHLDTDEANALYIKNGDVVDLLINKS